MRTSLEAAEFLQQGPVPFALAACEKMQTHPVTGYYDELAQTWEGLKGPASITLTLTQTPQGPDNGTD